MFSRPRARMLCYSFLQRTSGIRTRVTTSLFAKLLYAVVAYNNNLSRSQRECTSGGRVRVSIIMRQCDMMNWRTLNYSLKIISRMGITSVPGERQFGDRPPESLAHVLKKMGKSTRNVSIHYCMSSTCP